MNKWWALAILFLVIVLALGAVWWSVVRPDLAPHARAQAQLAEQDPIWRMAPRTMKDRNQHWAILEGDNWRRWDRAEVTTIGRHYDMGVASQSGFPEWERAAIDAGWRLVGRICDRNYPEANYAKQLGEWSAILHVKSGIGVDVFTVYITIPASETGQIPSGNQFPVGSLETPADCLDGV